MELPVVSLPYPHILLPAGRLTIPVTNVAPLLRLLKQDQPLVLAAVPLVKTEGGEYQSHDKGCAARIVRFARGNGGQSQPQITLIGLHRIDLHKPLPPRFDDFQTHPVITNDVDLSPSADTVEVFRNATLRLLDRLAKNARPSNFSQSELSRLSNVVTELDTERASWVADLVLNLLQLDWQERLDFLALIDPEVRLQRVAQLCAKEASIAEVTKKISVAVDERLSKQQQAHFLRQQLAAIQRELNHLSKTENSTDAESEEDQDDLEELKRRIESMDRGTEARKMAMREFNRLKRIPQGSVEQGVIRNYLEWLTSLPWSSPASLSTAQFDLLKDPGFLASARAQLDQDHFGLERIKRRLIEYLAVMRLKLLASVQDQGLRPSNTGKVSNKGPILLFVGPPGCGKTSIASSLAKALGKPLQRISLGGVRDEAEIRGHRRTYVASAPGSIVQALRKAGRQDPMILLDELDKVGHSSFHGDPSAALLEVLDPEQNCSFNDHYINVPIDLSQVVFIATANSLETIPTPLLDRCEVIRLSGYTYNEKLHIARRFLLPKELEANGLSPLQLSLSDAVLLKIATSYTREAGVRSLQRAVGSVIRYKAVEWAEHSDNPSVPFTSTVDSEDLEKILGPPRWDDELRDARRGVVHGLVVMGEGEGGVMPVETLSVPGSGSLRLTGSLGEVIRESAEIALSWVKSHAFQLGITSSNSQDPLANPSPMNIHLHLPAGAQKKDGPSAGVAMVCAIVSLLTGAIVPSDVAMTGEVTLSGKVMPVGGIKEKVLGAHRARITKVILPYHSNRGDVERDVPSEIREQMKFEYVKTVEEALDAAFGIGVLGWRRGSLFVESHL